ncbi:hypothetical protein [Schaedlerella arabinosiphila]|uniref:hypothetical protein n=1 Tax=Schaedlerella arabinosiphila TaxID=2044587 RepID=UPI00255810BC|nr:hypothetical protein [Schaedlerella arabinosiphila]
MKKKVLIFGTTMFSKEMMHYLQKDDKWEILGFTLDRDYKKEEFFCDYKVYPFEDLEIYFNMENTEILPSIGYSGMNSHRKLFFEKCEKKGYKIASYIDRTAINYAKSIGKGNIILDFVQLGHECTLGTGNIIKGTCGFAHDSQIGDFNYFGGSDHIGGAVIVGNENFFGISCIIRSQIKIGNENLIGAGTYLSESIGKYTVVSPAKARIVKSSKRAISLFLD